LGEATAAVAAAATTDEIDVVAVVSSRPTSALVTPYMFNKTLIAALGVKAVMPIGLNPKSFVKQR
jgi:ABC-type transporter Mla maintaining outer membrane lipid asymmetry permease subunit MlaE